MAGNASLNKAAQAKQDEFYTQLADIENELRHYKEHFRGKTVLCNCDDPYESNFFKYFAMNFQHLGLKKLIATCYVSSPVMYTQLSLFEDMEQAVTNPRKKPYKVEITEVEDLTGNGAVDLDDIKLLLKNKKNICTVLKGDGDFRSEECIEFLKEADIVVTNPPFSLLREYIALLVSYQKKFLIIGNQNATHYKEIFPLIMNNSIWLGYNHVKEFMKPDGSIQKFGNVVWLTNLDIDKRHEEMILYKTYTPEEYPKYVNFDAIDVGKVADIPCDYYGNMGVPDSFIEKYNPTQFEILGLAHGVLSREVGFRPIGKEWCDLYFSQGNKGHFSPSMCEPVAIINGKAVSYYSRIIIRRKEQPT